MANPNIKFFRNNVAPSNPQEGYIWFNSTNNTIQLYKNGAWEIYTGKINDVTYADGKLTIVPHVGESTIIDLGSVANISDLSTRLGTLEGTVGTHTQAIATIIGKLEGIDGLNATVGQHTESINSLKGLVGETAVATQITNAIDALDNNGAKGESDYVDVTVTQVDGVVNEVAVDGSKLTTILNGVNKTISDEVTRATTKEGELEGALNTEKGRIDTLVGDDSGSIRDIAVDVLTETLVSESASEAFDTLQEVSAWIKEHPESAAEMNEKIGTNTTNIATLTGKVENLEKIDHDAYKAADSALETALKSYADTAEADAISAAEGLVEELANGQVNTNATNIATNTADIEAIKGQVETINTTIEENELTIASALTDLDSRINSLADSSIANVETDDDFIYTYREDGNIYIGAVIGSVANGEYMLATASDVKDYVDDTINSTWTWAEF